MWEANFGVYNAQASGKTSEGPDVEAAKDAVARAKASS